MRQIIDEISARERQKAEMRLLERPAEAYKRKQTMQKLLAGYSKKLGRDERETIENIIEHIEDLL